MAAMSTPTGWAAVYALVQDSEKRVMTHLTSLSEEVAEVKLNQATHLLAHAAHDGAEKQTGKILNASKTFIVTVVAISNALVAFVVAAANSGGK
jgi:Cu/Ag efflux pump CusA